MTESQALATRRSVMRAAFPIMLANAAAPALGLVDTAVIGRVGSTQDLGAVALGALIFNFVFWSFGFLRMGTTGFVAQAVGAGDELEMRAAAIRALILAFVLGIGLVVLQIPIAYVAFSLLGASAQVEGVAREYFAVRIWSAPAALGNFVAMGVLVGLGQSRRLLVLQLVLNGLNISLDLIFAGVLGLGARGIAMGTALSEWCTLVVSLSMCKILLRERSTAGVTLWPWQRIADFSALERTLTVNLDIMVRTLFLLAGFAWFTDQSARFGDAVLAANHVLLQLVSISAFVLDGYAFAAESVIGAAVGASSLAAFDAAVRRSTELAALTALALAATIALAGAAFVQALTDLPRVAEVAVEHLPFAATYVLFSFAAFQLDGVFIGATRTRDMRNAAILSFFAFIAVWALLPKQLSNGGLWLSFICYVVVRALTLFARYPALRHAIGARPPQP